MRILYIVGNGFDLNLGLKTDYHSFYKYYLDQPTSNPAILKLKEKITQEQYTNWSDLELGLGRYAEECSKDEYLLIFDDIRANLIAYLKAETENLNYGLSDTFLSDLKRPQSHLERIVLDDFDQYFTTYFYRREEESVIIDIMTFNYTYTFERLLEWPIGSGDSIINMHQNYGDNTIVEQLIHVHGTLDNELNLGVNDITQILNDNLNDDEEVIDNAVKPVFNDACLNGNNSACEELINGAEIIVLFGVSMGETDSKWWSLIGQKIYNERCVVIFYPFDAKKDDKKHPNSKRRWTKNYITFLKERMGISDIDDSNFWGLIKVGVNKPLFRGITVRKLNKEEGK